MTDSQSPLEDLSGPVPLFPLPKIAFFPNLLLPLHIFEPRYRQMTADALEGDRQIAIAQLKPGWETWPDDAPPIYDYLCLGHILVDEKLEDGRYMIVLRGVSRAKLAMEEEAELPYRVGQLEMRADRAAEPSLIDRANRRRELLEAFRDLSPGLNLDKLLLEAIDSSPSLGELSDVLASTLPLNADEIQQILEEEDIDVRSDLVLKRLRALRRKNQGRPSPRSFPPDFSLN